MYRGRGLYFGYVRIVSCFSANQLQYQRVERVLSIQGSSEGLKWLHSLLIYDAET